MKCDNFNDLAELVLRGLASKAQIAKERATGEAAAGELTAGEAAEGVSLKTMPLIVAIDGMSSALKTTLSEKLSDMFDGAVIHCDDFFLPLEFRTQERFAEPGGNIHYERMKAEVIDKFPDELKYSQDLIARK